MRNYDIRCQSLDLLRFPLAVTVLAVHVFSTTGILVGGSVCNIFLLDDIQCFVDVFLRGQSVPIYYFISGYVFFLGIELTLSKYMDKLRNRVKTLLIPYITFNLICILLQVIIVAGSISLNEFTLKNLFSCFYAYDGFLPGTTGGLELPILGPTGFLRDLMFVVVCTPILNIALKGKGGIITICLFAAMWIYNNLFGLDVYLPYSAFLFFSLGAFMSINRMDMIVKFRSVNVISIFIYIVSSLIMIFMHTNNSSSSLMYTGFKSLSIFFGLIVLFNLAVFLLESGFCKVNKVLASSSFFVYITHTMICGRLLKVLFIVFEPQSSFSMLLCFVATIIISVLVLVSVFIIMKSYTPRFLTFITGRR